MMRPTDPVTAWMAVTVVSVGSTLRLMMLMKLMKMNVYAVPRSGGKVAKIGHQKSRHSRALSKSSGWISSVLSSTVRKRHQPKAHAEGMRPHQMHSTVQ